MPIYSATVVLHIIQPDVSLTVLALPGIDVVQVVTDAPATSATTPASLSLGQSLH